MMSWGPNLCFCGLHWVKFGYCKANMLSSDYSLSLFYIAPISFKNKYPTVHHISENQGKQAKNTLPFSINLSPFLLLIYSWAALIVNSLPTQLQLNIKCSYDSENFMLLLISIDATSSSCKGYENLAPLTDLLKK